MKNKMKASHIRLAILSILLAFTAFKVGREILMPIPVNARLRPGIAQVATPDCKALLQDYLDSGSINNKIKMEQIGTSYLDKHCRVGSLLSAMHFLKSHESISETSNGTL